MAHLCTALHVAKETGWRADENLLGAAESGAQELYTHGSQLLIMLFRHCERGSSRMCSGRLFGIPLGSAPFAVRLELQGARGERKQNSNQVQLCMQVAANLALRTCPAHSW